MNLYYLIVLLFRNAMKCKAFDGVNQRLPNVATDIPTSKLAPLNAEHFDEVNGVRSMFYMWRLVRPTNSQLVHAAA